mmetsp:Transcript_36090/g.69196  ORF Transcript_36090/g.69196 Transcript_36090/m.69196 type:complete len:294 (-) Transcript_36090:1565-2446(-)
MPTHENRRPVPRLQDVNTPPGLVEYRPQDPAAEAAWFPPDDAPSFEEFIAAGGRAVGVHDVSNDDVLPEPVPPPAPTFHHVRPGPDSGKPWLHPDLTNAVCSSMSRGDIQVLAKRMELENSHAAGTREIVKASGQVWTLTKYSWDDGHMKDFTREHVSVYIPLREYDCSKLTKEKIEVIFGEQNFSLKVHLPEGNVAQLVMRKLAHPIIPEGCRFRLDAKAKKITLKLKKKPKDGSTTHGRWMGLADGYHSVHQKNNIGRSLLRPAKWDAEMIDIEHVRHWDGPPKYDMYSDE